MRGLWSVLDYASSCWSQASVCGPGGREEYSLLANNSTSHQGSRCGDKNAKLVKQDQGCRYVGHQEA